jgi:hypothetical protein
MNTLFGNRGLMNVMRRGFSTSNLRPDKVVSIAPYFTMNENKVDGAYYAAHTQVSATVGAMDQFKAKTKEFYEMTLTERQMNHYGFSYLSYDSSQVACREGYSSASGLMHHMGNIGGII